MEKSRLKSKRIIELEENIQHGNHHAMETFWCELEISDKPSEAVIGGLSLGGLTASYMGLNHSDVFGNILSQSGSYWYQPEGFENEEGHCWMSTQYLAADQSPLKFYLNSGVLETKDRIIDTNNNLRDVLISKGHTVDFEEFKSGHDYLCWGETLAHGLISLIGMTSE